MENKARVLSLDPNFNTFMDIRTYGEEAFLRNS